MQYFKKRIVKESFSFRPTDDDPTGEFDSKIDKDYPSLHWHMHSKKKFKVNKNKGPRDWTTGNDKMHKGYMETVPAGFTYRGSKDTYIRKGKWKGETGLEGWADNMPEKKYATAMDISKTKHKSFERYDLGPETMVAHPEKAKQKKTYPIDKAIEMDRRLASKRSAHERITKKREAIARMIAKRKTVSEDAPTNNVGSGNLAGMGVEGKPNQEPGVSRKKKSKSPVLFPSMMRRTLPSNIKEGILNTVRDVYSDVKGGNYSSATNKIGSEVVKQSMYHIHPAVAAAAHVMEPTPANAGENEILRQNKMQREDLDTFMGSVVFEVDSSTFHSVKYNKRKYQHWKKYLGEDDSLHQIREYAYKNPSKPIIIRNKLTSEMMYVKYGKKR